jgi:uncharacterized repeat protein (TIGR03803 family)
MSAMHSFVRVKRDMVRGIPRGAACLLAIQIWHAAQVAASAAELRLLHSFPVDSYPQSTLVFGDDGALYGTTQKGGDFGYGSIFCITPNGNFTNLFSFGRTNGAYPYSGLLKTDGGNFYGTAQNYGSNGFGTVFRITTNGSLTTLFSFASTNGAYPKGTLIMAKDGSLYGTTFGGGTLGYGTIFRITTNGMQTLLASFASTNGAYPMGGLIQGQDGAFYGSTWRGGNFDGASGYGTIYRVTSAGQFNMIYAFEGYGYAYPIGELLQVENGLMYGVTYGSIFQITTNGTFNPVGYNPLDPLYPRSSLIRGFDGAFYGTDENSAFRITTNGIVMRLCGFYNYGSGSDPRAGLVQAPDTSLYGTTAQGGPFGGGVVFRIELNTFFYPLTRATNGWNVLFAALAGNTYRVLRAPSLSGPWETAASVVTDDYGVGRWVDTSGQEKALYRLVYP